MEGGGCIGRSEEGPVGGVGGREGESVVRRKGGWKRLKLKEGEGDTGDETQNSERDD